MPGIALRSIALATAVLAVASATGTARAASDAYTVNTLVSDGGTTAPSTDASLVNGWGLSADSAVERFAANPNDPLFRLIDGATCPSDDVSTPEAVQQAYSLLTSKGLIRIGLPMQASMQFQIVAVQDAYGNCNTNSVTGLTGAKSGFLSFYRRPLPSANLGFLSGIMWDTREPSPFRRGDGAERPASSR